MSMGIIEGALQKYEITDNRIYDIGHLHTVIAEIGLAETTRQNFVRNWITRKIKRGVLILPDRPHGTREWKLTGKQIKEIIYAFAPGGEGKYDYREHE